MTDQPGQQRLRFGVHGVVDFGERLLKKLCHRRGGKGKGGNKRGAAQGHGLPLGRIGWQIGTPPPDLTQP